MAQGRAFTPEQRKTILESLKPYLEMGYSRSKACKFIGFDETTLCKWLSSDEALSMKIHSWENTINTLAMANIKSAIDKEAEDDNDKRKETTKWWLERRMKEDFSTKVENDLSIKELPTPILNVQGNNSDKEDNEDVEENPGNTGGDFSE